VRLPTSRAFGAMQRRHRSGILRQLPGEGSQHCKRVRGRLDMQLFACSPLSSSSGVPDASAQARNEAPANNAAARSPTESLAAADEALSNIEEELETIAAAASRSITPATETGKRGRRIVSRRLPTVTVEQRTKARETGNIPEPIKLRLTTTTPAELKIVWELLQEHEALWKKLPGITRCEQTRGFRRGEVQRITQVGLVQSVYWQLGGRAEVEFVGKQGALGSLELAFKSKGEAAQFEGRWLLEDHDPAGMRSLNGRIVTRITYELMLIPPDSGIPKQILQQQLESDAQVFVDLVRSRSRLSSLGLVSRDAMNLPPDFGSDFGSSSVFYAPAASRAARQAVLVAQFTYNTVADYMESAFRGMQNPANDAGGSAEWLGVNSVPIPQANGTPVSNAPRADTAQGGNETMQVHLRRMDRASYKVRRASASVEIDAPADLVWQILTDYDNLATFTPGLVRSEKVPLTGAELEETERNQSEPSNRRVRLRQIGYKLMPYVLLRADSVLDLLELPAKGQVRFVLAEGALEKVQGLWSLKEDVERGVTTLSYVAQITVAGRIGRYKKFVVREPLAERVVYEDIPHYLSAVRERVRTIREIQKVSETDGKRLPANTSLTALGIALKEFAETEIGKPNVMPTRKQLREAGKTDIESLITAFGGYANVAKLLGLTRSTQKKPRGYWTDQTNMRREIQDMQEELGLAPDVMPSKPMLRQAGRSDLVRAIDNAGGVALLAETLGLKPPTKQSSGQYAKQRLRSVKRTKGLPQEGTSTELGAASNDGSDMDATNRAQ